ncbi:MAG: hypothetical protein LBB92_00240 [Endomicrobium sp.]|nr:hypothetical protein [Endomicrobium sp.]
MFVSDNDLELLLRKDKINLFFLLESKNTLKSFDILSSMIQCELVVTNILDLLGIFCIFFKKKMRFCVN